MNKQLHAIATALLALCTLSPAMAGEESLSFTPELISLERRGDGTNGATIRGELTLPEAGLLFQPEPYTSGIPEQEKPHQGAFIYYKNPPQRFLTPAQPLAQSSALHECTIATTLKHFWPSFNERPQFNLDIELSDIPSSGELQLKEQIPFILAQGAIFGETKSLKSEQVSLLKESTEDTWEVKRYHIKLGIPADKDIYSTQFFNAEGELMKPHLCQVKINAEGELELEGEFISSPPSSFRTVKLREPRPITLKLNATLKLPAEQIARGIQQSLGENSPYQSQWMVLALFLKAPESPSMPGLNFRWTISGFKGKTAVGQIRTAPQQKELILIRSSELNESSTKLSHSNWGEATQEFKLSLRQKPHDHQLHFDETLTLKLFEGSETSEPLPLNAKQSTTHSVNGQEFTASPESQDEYHGFRITGIQSDDSFVKITFSNAQGEPIKFSGSISGGGRKGVFYSFRSEQPADFQIEYQTKPKTLSLPCRFTIPLPQWVETNL